MKAFACVLPRYFRGKSYRAFERQLKAYDFRRTKRVCGGYEFTHPKFRRGNFSELATIKRKVCEYSEVLATFKDDHQIMAREYNKLKRNFVGIENALKLVTSQNRQLVETNKQLTRRVHYFKSEYNTRVKKVLFCFYVSGRYSDEELSEHIRSVLVPASQLNSDTDYGTLIAHIQAEVREFAKRSIFANENTCKTLDSLVSICLAHYNEKVRGNDSHIDYDALMHDIFCDDKADVHAHAHTTDLLASAAELHDGSTHLFVPLASRPADELSVSSLANNTDNMSEVYSISECCGEEALLHEVTQKLANTTRSITDSLCESEHSLGLFSPKSEAADLVQF